MNDLFSLVVLIAAVVAIALLFVWAFRKEKQVKKSFADSLKNILPMESTKVNEHGVLSDLDIPSTILKGRFGRAKLEPIVRGRIGGKRVYLFGYRTLAENIDVYANRSIIAIDLQEPVPLAIVASGRGFGRKMIVDLDVYNELSHVLPAKCQIYLDSSISENSSNYFMTKKWLSGDALVSLLDGVNVCDWIEMSDEFILLVGPRKINNHVFKNMCDVARNLLDNWVKFLE